jgi:2-(1,2-epoxy-1,2-dihydrophenyl)acetyl-CoA isomerase
MSSYLNETYSDLLLKKDGALLWVTLNRPEQSNAFTDAFVADLCWVLQQADWDDEVRVIILTGAGKAFCSGGDLDAMEEQTGMFAGDPEELRRRYVKGIQQIPIAMEATATPIVAMVNGAAIGGGCDIACMCDIRIGCQYTLFGETFAKLGVVPGDGGTFSLQRVVGYAKAMELSLTAKIIDAGEALKIGLLNHLVDKSELRSKTEELAKVIAANSPIAIPMIKKAIRQARTAELAGHLELLAAYQGIAQRTDDHLEGVRALKGKRTPKFKGR